MTRIEYIQSLKDQGIEAAEAFDMVQTWDAENTSNSTETVEVVNVQNDSKNGAEGGPDGDPDKTKKPNVLTSRPFENNNKNNEVSKQVHKFVNKKQQEKFELENVEYENILDLVTSATSTLVDGEVSEEEIEEVKVYAEANNMSFEEAAKKKKLYVTVGKIQDVGGVMKPIYTTTKGKADRVEFLNNKKLVIESINPRSSNSSIDKLNDELNAAILPYGEFIENEFVKSSFYERGMQHDNKKARWAEVYGKQVEKDYDAHVYSKFINAFDRKYGYIADRHIDNIGNEYQVTDAAGNVVNMLNAGVPVNEVKERVSDSQFGKVKNITTNFFIKKGDKTIRQTSGSLKTGKYSNDKQTEGVNLQKAEDVMSFYSSFGSNRNPFANGSDKAAQWESARKGQINRLIDKYEGDGDTKLTEEDLMSPKGIKKWYGNYIERGVDFDFEDDFRFLYNKKTGELVYGTKQYVDDRRNKDIQKGINQEDVIYVDSEEERLKLEKLYKSNLGNFLTENNNDLNSVINQSYHNVLGLQKLLVDATGNNDFKKNIEAGEILSKPVAIKGDSYLVKKYNQEVAKLAIMSQSYVLNFDPIKIEKSGFWEGVGEALFEKVGSNSETSDEVRQAFYEGFIAKHPEISKDPAFSEEAVNEIYDKTFLNKVGYGTPDFLMIMAEFALTRKLAGSGFKKLGKLAEMFAGGVGGGAKTSRYVGAFVEELASIQSVNFAFDAEMSSAFAITGPVGKMLDDFYKGFFAEGATGGFKAIGGIINKAPRSITIPADGVLKIGTSATVLKVGEIPESIMQSLSEGSVSPLLHVFDPEEFAVLAAQLTITKGAAPIKGAIETADQAVKDIKTWRGNKKYKAQINKYNNLIFGEKGGSNSKNPETRNRDIQSAADLAFEKIGISPRIISFLRANGFTKKQIEEANSIEELVGDYQGSIRETLLTGKENGITIDKIKEAAKISDAEKGLKLESEYLSFLEAQKREGLSNQTVTLKKFANQAQEPTGGKQLILDNNTLQAFKYLKSPTLIKKFLDSYGVKPDNNGNYKSDVLNLMLDPGKEVKGVGSSYPNLSYLNSKLALGTKNNIDYTTNVGKRYLNNVSKVILADKTIKDIKAQLEANPVSRKDLEKDLELAEDAKQAYENAEVGIIEDAKAENIVKTDKLIDKISLEKSKLGLDDVTKVSDQYGLKLHFKNKTKESKDKAEELQAEIDGLKEGDPKINELKELKENYLKDAVAYAKAGIDIKPGYLHKGKAYTSKATGRKEIVFNMEDIFKSGGDPTVAPHETFHPFINQKLKELGLSQNSQKLNSFMKDFVGSLSSSQISTIETRLDKQGIDLNKYEDLSSGQKLEIFNAYVEGVVLGEITYKPGSKEAKQAAEVFENFIEKESGVDVNLDPVKAIESITAEFAQSMRGEMINIEGGRRFDAIAGMISNPETADLFDYSVQSSKEYTPLETTLNRFENDLKNLKPSEAHRKPTIVKNIKAIKNLLLKSDEIQKNIDIIDASIEVNKGNVDMALEATSTTRAQNELVRLANKPGGVLRKLKDSFDLDKVDQQLNFSDKLELKAEFDGAADLFFSMSLKKYLEKPIDQRRPLEVYLKAGLGKKFTDVMNKAKINQSQFNTRITELNERGIMNTPAEGGNPFSAGSEAIMVPVKSSPFKFGKNVNNAVSKALLDIYSIKETDPKKFTKIIDNSIKIFVVDPIREEVAYVEGKNGKLKLDKDKLEKHLFDNYEKVVNYIEGNNPWFRLRNFDLFYENTGKRVQVKKGKEDFVYNVKIPTQKEFVDFFMAKDSEFEARDRNQRTLKYFELLGRIQVGTESMGPLAENGGVVEVNGRKVNVFNNLEYNESGIKNFERLQTYEIPEPDVQSSVEIDPNTLEGLVKNTEYKNEVRQDLSSLGITPQVINMSMLAKANGDLTFKLDETTYNTANVREEIQNVANTVAISKIIPSKGESKTTIVRTRERAEASTPNYKLLEKDKGLSKEEIDSRKKAALEAANLSDAANITRAEAAKRRESNKVKYFDYKEKTVDKVKYKNYVEGATTLLEYMPDMGTPTKNAVHAGDNYRGTGTGIVVNGERIPSIVEAAKAGRTGFSVGSKNNYGTFNLSETQSLGQAANLATFLKMDPAELDMQSNISNVNKQKVTIKNLLRKNGIDYKDPNAKNQVMELLMSEKSNAPKRKALRAKYLGVFDAFWDAKTTEEASNIWAVWTEITKADSNNINGTKSLASNTFMLKESRRHEDIWEKQEHGFAIANFNEQANAFILNGDRAGLLKLTNEFNSGYGDRDVFNKQDEASGTTSSMSEGYPEETKVLQNTGEKGEVTFDKDGKRQVAFKPISNKKYHDNLFFKYKGKTTSFTEAFELEIQSSKEVTTGEMDIVKNRVFNNVVKDGEIKKGEIPKVINQVKKEVKVSNQNKKVDKEFTTNKTSQLSENSTVPSQDVLNSRFIDEGNSSAWTNSFKITKVEGEYEYNAENGVATVPNNTGKFSPKRKVVFLAGGAGSGKGTTWSKILEQHPELKDLEIINSDIDKQSLKEQLNLDKDESNYDEAERSLLSRITSMSVKGSKDRVVDLSKEGNGFVVDGTLASYKSNKKTIDNLKEKGYDIQIVYTKTDVETASRRNAERKERSIKDRFLRINHESVNSTINKFIKDGENVIEFNGEGDFNIDNGNQVFNSLNKSNKVNMSPELGEVGVQNSVEFYTKESNRIASKFAGSSEAPMDKATADKIASGKKGKVKFMGFRAQQAKNLMLEIVGKNDVEAAKYLEGGVDLADKGRYDFGRYSTSTRKDIKFLNKSDQYKNVGLDKNALTIKDAEGKKIGDWSRGDAVRMYLWFKNGKEVKDVDENTVMEAYDYVVKDELLMEYANNIDAAVSKTGEPWLDSYDGWSGTSLKYDIDKAIESRRSEFMSPFNEWYETTFSQGNLNKIKAGMGSKGRSDFNSWYESVSDWHERAMTNRTRAKGEKVGQSFVNWLHGSTALALFGNRKSMFTQLLSTSNFYGAENNSVFDAAKAYGSKDIFNAMRHILNSEYLSDRRGSYDLALKEINELETKFGNAYKKGINFSFLLSQLGDNAAIVFGGSSMLLNNAKAIMKSDPNISKEQAYDMAMEKVAMHSERTQQSTWASNLTYQQTKAIGKVTLNFLNTQVRYNNIALEEIKKIRKGVSDNSMKSMMRVVNYTAMQTAAFGFLSSGLQYSLMDDEENYPMVKGEDGESISKLDQIKEQKKSDIIMNTAMNIINGTGIKGKGVTTLIGMLDEVLEFGSDTQKREAKIAKKALQMSPALSIKFNKLESAAYDIQAAFKNYKDGSNWTTPALRAGTELFSAGTNIAAPEYALSMMDQFEAIMDERNSFWQSFGVAMGWSLYTMDNDFYKKRKEKEASGDPLFKTTTTQSPGGYVTKGRKSKVTYTTK